MIKYTSIDAVLNYIPAPMLAEVDVVQIKSWAYQAYRDYSLPFTENTKSALVSIKNHKGLLPDDVMRIVEVRYTEESYPKEPGYETIEIGDDRYLIYQQIFFSDPTGYFQRMKPLLYIGQMRGELITEELYCNECKYGFSVDARLRCITIDAQDGNVLVIYRSPVTDDGDFLVPDDPTLLQGLSAFAQSHYWRDKTFSHEQNAVNLQQSNMQEATTLLTKFKGKRLLASVNPAKHREFVFTRNRKPRR